MKPVLIALSIIVTTWANCQDLIVVNENRLIACDIIHACGKLITYQTKIGTKDTVLTIPKDKVLGYKYTKRNKYFVYAADYKLNLDTTEWNELDKDALVQFIRGAQDARLKYKGYKTAGTTTLLSTFASTPIGGLAPAIAFSSTPPKEKNLNLKDEDRSQYYLQGYSQAAHKIKRNKVWLNYAVASTVETSLAAYLLIQIAYAMAQVPGYIVSQ